MKRCVWGGCIFKETEGTLASRWLGGWRERLSLWALLPLPLKTFPLRMDPDWGDSHVPSRITKRTPKPEGLRNSDPNIRQSVPPWSWWRNPPWAHRVNQVFSFLLPAEDFNFGRDRRIGEMNSWLHRWYPKTGFGCLNHGRWYENDRLLAKRRWHLSKQNEHVWQEAPWSAKEDFKIKFREGSREMCSDETAKIVCCLCSTRPSPATPQPLLCAWESDPTGCIMGLHALRVAWPNGNHCVATPSGFK